MTRNTFLGRPGRAVPEYAGGSLFPWPWLIIMTTAFAVVLPFFFLGIPSGHDFEFHVNSWMEVLSQWRQGIIYPRWADQAHFGYGEARFIFYPPFSWAMGATLGAILPWKLAPGAYIWMALTLSGCAMFLLARRWLAPRDAIFAAAFYAANPYHIVIVYWRSAFAELLAGALLPLLVLWLLRCEEEGRRAVIALALIVAATWFSNAPAAVILIYSLALLAVIVAIMRRSPRILLHAAFALLLGTALAAVYVLPAAYEETWVNIFQVLSPGVRPQDNFLFTTINDADHNQFNLLVSLVASAEIIVLGAAAVFSRNWKGSAALPTEKKTSSVASPPDLRWALLAWASAATLLMFSFSFLLWQYLPQLRFVQFSWRWLLCLNVALSLLVTMAWRRWLVRLLVCLAMLAVLAFVWHRVQPPWWDTAADIAEMQTDLQEGRGYEGIDEYVPIGADSSEINKDARRVTLEGEGRAQIHVYQWGAESKYFTAEVSERSRLPLRLFNYPAWKVEVNGRLVEPETREVTGQMVIPVEAGENRVSITFTRTRDRTVGGIVSAVSVLVCTLLIFRWR